MKDHEQSQKPSKSAGKRKRKEAKCLKKSSETVVGSAHIQTEVLIDSDEEVNVIPCCVCESREPPQDVRRRSGIDILDWAQCDGLRNGMPCLQRVHQIHQC